MPAAPFPRTFGEAYEAVLVIAGQRAACQLCHWEPTATEPLDAHYHTWKNLFEVYTEDCPPQAGVAHALVVCGICLNDPQWFIGHPEMQGASDWPPAWMGKES